MPAPGFIVKMRQQPFEPCVATKTNVTPACSALGRDNDSDGASEPDEVQVRSEIDMSTHGNADRRILSMPMSVDLAGMGEVRALRDGGESDRDDQRRGARVVGSRVETALRWVLRPEKGAFGMPGHIDLEGLRRLMDEGAQVVDVLPAREYAEDHIPGAINLPLRRIETEGRQVLDPDRPIVVYCADSG
jgi:Rhodanese-like domain